MKQTVEKAFNQLPISYVSGDFKSWFFPMKFNPKAKCENLTSQKLPRVMTSKEILEELKPSEISIEEVVETLKTMSHDMWALFYCKDKGGVPRLVRAHWLDVYGGWYVFAYDASDSARWHDESQLFSRNSRSPLSFGSSDTLSPKPFDPSDFEKRLKSLEDWRERFIKELSNPMP